MSILKYIEKKPKSVSDKLERLVKGKSKKDRRQIEEHLAKPSVLPVYVGQESKFASVSHYGVPVTVVFKEKDFKIFRKYFKVNEYAGFNIHRIDLLMSLLEKFEEGVLSYDNESKKLYLKRDGKRKRI